MSSTKPPPLWLEASIARSRLLIGKDADEDEQKRRFYEALLHIDWLPSRVRGAILRELDSSLRQQQRGYARKYALIWRHLIEQAEDRMRERGERPPGGIHDAAVDQIAERFGIKFDALKKRLQRSK